MARGHVIALLAAGALVSGGCAATVDVTTERADPIRVPTVEMPSGTAPGSDDDAVGGSDPAPAPDVEVAAPSTPTTAPTVPPPSGAVDADSIDMGPNKPARPYDEFLFAVATDLEQWWTEQYPAIYGRPFEPLAGAIYAAYPDRPDDLPGCGIPRTTYDDVAQYVAFYCGDGDFIVYDDGPDGLLAQLARDDGAATIGAVLAHEYAHAIQLRSGGLDRGLATIVTEQQADCFAGAWTARAARGEAPTVRFSDGDVRAGLIAMTKVSDPVGLDQFEHGGHGSAFDRVGAFQVGYNEGPVRCAELLDTPLPLMPNEFVDLDDITTEGDAAFGYGENDLVGFLPEDLNRYWDEELADRIPALDRLDVVVVQGDDEVVCDDLRGNLDAGAAVCTSTDRVYFNEPVALDLYRTHGDFAVGYVLGGAWSEAVQVALDSELDGETRVLLNDCLTGGWVKTIIPVDFALPQPRLGARDSVRTSPGDLDEAIQTMLDIADSSIDDDVIGNSFEKIDAFRTGVIEGTASCLSRL